MILYRQLEKRRGRPPFKVPVYIPEQGNRFFLIVGYTNS